MKKTKETRQEKWLKKFGADNTYNKDCKHYIKTDDECKCKLRMEMFFCNNKCAYATNQKLTNVVDGYGKVKGIKNVSK